jgi:hypothetical protein
VLDFPVSQWPASDFSCSKAAVPLSPARAGPIANANTIAAPAAKTFVVVLMFLKPPFQFMDELNH